MDRSISRESIHERDGWTCQLCHLPVDPRLHPLDALYPTLDHIVPLAHGGTHTRGNLQTTHRACNLAKGDTLPDEP